MEFVKGMRKVKGEWLWEDEREEKRTSGKKNAGGRRKLLKFVGSHVYARTYCIVIFDTELSCIDEESSNNTTEAKSSIECLAFLIYTSLSFTEMPKIPFNMIVDANDKHLLRNHSLSEQSTKKEENRTKNIVIDVGECGTCHPNVALRSLFHWNENFDALSVLRIAKSFSHTTNRNNSELPNNNKNNNNDYIWSVWAHRFAHFAWNVQMNCIFPPLATNSNHTIPDRICALELTMCFRLLLFKCLNWL